MERFSLKADFVVKELFVREKVRKQFLSDVLDIPLEEIKSVRQYQSAGFQIVSQ